MAMNQNERRAWKMWKMRRLVEKNEQYFGKGFAKILADQYVCQATN